MSRIGYYRYKLEGLTKGVTNVTFYVNFLPFVTHKVIVRDTCTGWRQLKWIDNETGRYLFFAFLDLYAVKDNPKSIGKTSNFITSLFDSQTDSKNIGQTNDRTLTLRAINVTAEEREILSSIFTSPKVFLYTGDFTKDEKSDYVLVDVKGDNVVRFEKSKPSKVDLTVTLPKHYTITQL